MKKLPAEVVASLLAVTTIPIAMLPLHLPPWAIFISWAATFAMGGPTLVNLKRIWATLPVGAFFAFLIVLGFRQAATQFSGNALVLAGRRASKDGTLMIEASRSRSQDRNREEARERLKELILEAAKPPPPPRKKTRPTRGSVERRLKEKAGRSDVKKMRGRPSGGD